MPDPFVVEIAHPLVRHKVTLLRDAATTTRDFRQLASEIAGMLAYEATRELELEPVAVTTPLETTSGWQVSGKKVGVVPILRAGVGMLDGVLAMIPVARVGFLGMYRDEQTLQPVVYYSKLPGEMTERDAVRLCKEQGARSVRLLSIIAAPEGIAALHAAHPDVEIYCAAIDRQLNDVGYILPGLGDAGDRIWGTR
jgi:uracil phosphoribosyltransferase